MRVLIDTTGEAIKKHMETVRDIRKKGFPGGPVVKDLPCNEGTVVQSLVQEDPTCCKATKPVCHNY